MTLWICVIRTLYSEMLRTSMGIEDDFLLSVRRWGQPWLINTCFTVLYTLIRDVTNGQLLKFIQMRGFLGRRQPEEKGHFQADEQGSLPRAVSLPAVPDHDPTHSTMSAKARQNPVSNKRTYLRNRNRLTDIEKRLGVAGGGGDGLGVWG